MTIVHAMANMYIYIGGIIWNTGGMYVHTYVHKLCVLYLEGVH